MRLKDWTPRWLLAARPGERTTAAGVGWIESISLRTPRDISWRRPGPEPPPCVARSTATRLGRHRRVPVPSSSAGGGEIYTVRRYSSPPWWRPIRDLPLIVLAILSVVAAVVGWVTRTTATPDATQPATVATRRIAAACGASAFPPRALPRHRRPSPGSTADGSSPMRAWYAHATSSPNGRRARQRRVGFHVQSPRTSRSRSVVGSCRPTRLRPGTTTSRRSRARSTQRGSRSSIVIPSATSAYPEQLPEWTNPIRGSNSFDQMLASESGLPIVDFRSAARRGEQTPCHAQQSLDRPRRLRSLADVAPITTVRCIRIPSRSRCRQCEGGRIERDLQRVRIVYGVPDATPEWTTPVFADELAPVVGDGFGRGAVAVTAGEGAARSVQASRLDHDGRCEQRADGR